MSNARRLLGYGTLGLALALGATGCGGDEEPQGQQEAGAQAPDYATPQAAYTAVVKAYVDDECDAAAALVDGTDKGVEQFLTGCAKRENLDVIRSLKVQGSPGETTLDPLPAGVSEAVRLTAVFTNEIGESTDYYPDMVRTDEGWRLWLPGDTKAEPSPPPAIESSAPPAP